MRLFTATAVISKAPITAALRTTFGDAFTGCAAREVCIEVPSMTRISIDRGRYIGPLHQMGSTALRIE
jgi:hypothetical protein